MADSPQRMRQPSAASASGHGAPRMPVLLFIPNLISIARILLSLYGLVIVAHTVVLQQERVAASLASCASFSVHALVKTASRYAEEIHKTGLLPPVSTTLLGKGLAHLSETLQGSSSKHDNSNATPFANPDLLAALVVFAVSALGDLLDGYAARKLNQQSHVGVLLDVVADNTLRSCMWLAAALLDARIALPALLFLSLEWLTLLSSQLVAQKDGGRHWKRQRAADPWVVRYFFSDNFRNPLGVVGIGGLFLAPLYPLVLHTFPALLALLREGSPVVTWTGYGLLAGRMVSAAVEAYFVGGLVTMLVEQQEEKQGPVALHQKGA